jgi:hypothetical protein
MLEVLFFIGLVAVLLFNTILFYYFSKRWKEKNEQLHQRIELLSSQNQKNIEILQSHILELTKEQLNVLQMWQEHIHIAAPSSNISRQIVPELSAPKNLNPNPHTLPLKISEELHRMKVRIKNMPPDIKGIGALKNAIKRIEEQLAEAGYQIIDYTGKPYIEGMNIEATFIPVEGFNADSPIITKVIRPQVSFNGELLKIASVEVSISS